MSAKFPGAGTSNIGYSISYIGSADYADIVVVCFTRPVNSPGADYALGVTIEVNAVGATISSAVRQSDTRIVHYTLSAAADANDTVTWAYNSAVGDLEDVSNSTTLPTVAAQTVVNQIGTQYWFDESECSGHIVTIGL